MKQTKQISEKTTFVVDLCIEWNTHVFTDDVKYRLEKALKEVLYNNQLPKVEVTKVVRVEE